MQKKTAVKVGMDYMAKFLGGMASSAGRGVGKNITSKPGKKTEPGMEKLLKSMGKDSMDFLFQNNNWVAFRDNVENMAIYAGRIALVGAGTATAFVFVPPIAAASVFCGFGAAAAGATYTAFNVVVPLYGASIMIKECNKAGKCLEAEHNPDLECSSI